MRRNVGAVHLSKLKLKLCGGSVHRKRRVGLWATATVFMLCAVRAVYLSSTHTDGAVVSPNGSSIAVQNQLGYLTSFILDAASQRICVIDANNARSTSIYSNRGLVIATQDPLGAPTSFTHDANRNAILRVDARNWPTTYTMDPLNRTYGTLYMDGSMVTNTWDAAAQQLTSQDITGVTSLLWDLNGRQIATQNPTGINLTNTLDPLGNRLVLADPWGATTYAWDAQSRLTGILNPLNEQTTIQWDPLNRESHRVLANGMAVSPRRHRSDSRDV